MQPTWQFFLIVGIVCAGCLCCSLLSCRESYEQLLLKYKVDMVFSGHTHAYERTKPIANYQVRSCGCQLLRCCRNCSTAAILCLLAEHMLLSCAQHDGGCMLLGPKHVEPHAQPYIAALQLALHGTTTKYVVLFFHCDLS
jgi:hypothetical protein